MDIGKIYKVLSTELGIGEVPQIGREGEIERGLEREMDIEKIYEVVSTELGKGEVREAGLAKIDIEKVRAAASAHYGDLTNDEKQAARKFFEAIDTNKSSSISIDEFRIFLSHAKIQIDDRLFEELDKDKDGTLDFQELVTFFYVLSRDEYKHLLYRRPSTGRTGGKRQYCEAVLAEINIEKVQEAVSAHYKDLTEDQKQPARILFETMEKDKSGDISIDELMVFLGVAGFQNNEHDWLFAELDKDNNATLDFKELATFFHVLSRDDEYKHLLNCWASTDLPDRKAKGRRQTAGAIGQGRSLDKGFFRGLYGKLKREYKVGEWEDECSIV